jgi:hypothetical protein
MKAIRIEEYGGPETLRLRNLELPDPQGHRDVKAMIEQTLATFGDNIFGTSYLVARDSRSDSARPS